MSKQTAPSKRYRSERLTVFQEMADQEADFSFQEPQPNDEYFHPIWDKKKDFILRYSENHRGGVKGWPFLNGIEKKKQRQQYEVPSRVWGLSCAGAYDQCFGWTL